MAILYLLSFMLFALYIQVDPTSCRTVRMLFLGNSPYSTEQFAVQRNEHILTKIVQIRLFLQKCGIDTKL